MKTKSRKDTPRRTPDTENKKKKHPVLWIVLALLLVGLALGAAHVIRILTKPTSLFTETDATAIPEPTVLAPAFTLTTPTPKVATPTPAAEEATPAPDDGSKTATEAPATEAPAAEATATPEPTAANRLNVMLLGIDAQENGTTTSGSMAHTDVMMVIAINFDANTVDLITLPRDTLTTAPGHYGYYKLNGVFNVGLGGWIKPTGKADELADGFLLTCRAAEEWLGGISIPYYYGVDFQAVIDIVDAIGGVDYDVDQAFQAMSGSRSYGTGMQHLDGDAVMGYLRIRQSADGLDSSRTARQRRMLVAIFNKLKTEGKLSQIPALIAAANSGIYTNTTLSQTTALATYATKLDADNIRTWSMSGEIGQIEYKWRFAYVDQQHRLDLIREVFGIEAEPVGICTRQYERWLHTVGFSALKYIRQAERVLNDVQAKKDAGTTFTEAQIALYSDCYWAYTALREAFDQATDTLSPLYAANSWREKKNDQRNWTEENKALDQEISAMEQEIRQNIYALQGALKKAAVRLGDAINFRRFTWSLSTDWYKDTDINEVIVAFG